MSADKKWYVVHTYSGFENKVKKSLEDLIKQRELHESFGQIFIPVEQVVEMRDGQKRQTKRKTMPGYIL
ncbi:MAG: transcription termination/antitermination protein NusG, partial [Myxococcaceae bacterium]|nr:transcription termination/antitermination protein NusG [Myxococcaceae bacterium]